MESLATFNRSRRIVTRTGSPWTPVAIRVVRQQVPRGDFCHEDGRVASCLHHVLWTRLLAPAARHGERGREGTEGQIRPALRVTNVEAPSGNDHYLGIYRRRHNRRPRARVVDD